MTLNLANIYEAVVEAIPDRAALTCGEVTLTFAELDARADRVAAWLQANGVKPGDHVGMQMHNGIAFCEAMVGCLKARAVPVNINWRYTSHELAYLYSDADLVAVFVEDEFAKASAAALAEAGAAADTLRHVIVASGNEGTDAAADGAAGASFPTGVSVTAYAEVTGCDAPAPARERSNDDTFVLYTGGTTGKPKGVVWRHEDFFHSALQSGNPAGEGYSSAAELKEAVPAAFPLVYLISMPLIHGAASYTLFTAWCMGAHVVLVRRFDPVAILEAIQKDKVNIVSIVGDALARPLYDALVRHKDDYDLSSWFILGSGGALFSKSVQDDFRTLMPNMIVRDNFGSSESGTDGQTAVGEDGQMRLTPTPHVKVVDQDHRELPPGSEDFGFVAHSGHVPLGYYNDPVKTAATFPVIDGVRWAVLGDVAKVEADGTIVVLGRGSQCINTGGEKVFPEEVEQALKSHPAVMDVLVAGFDDSRFGQRVGAAVELRDGSEVDAEELRAHVREQLAGYKVPARIVFVSSVVRSPSGKADYRWAKSAVADDGGAVDDAGAGDAEGAQG